MQNGVFSIKKHGCCIKIDILVSRPPATNLGRTLHINLKLSNTDSRFESELENINPCRARSVYRLFQVSSKPTLMPLKLEKWFVEDDLIIK